MPLLSVFALCITVFLGVLSCEKKEGDFYAAALGLNEDRVLVASQLATARTVSAYDLDGNLLGILADYQAEANGPRGLALYDSLYVLLSLDGDDRVDMVYLGGGRTSYIQGALFAGVIGRIIQHPNTLDYFVIENSNAIERFSREGQRIPVSGNSFVSGALAPCAAPSSLRALVINNNGHLLAVQSGTTAAFQYTIGSTNASACSALGALPANANDVINHSDGNLYWVSTNSNVYRASQTLSGSTSIFYNTATINTPTALAELPNGDLIIASDTTDSLEVISTSGEYKGTFRKDVNTQQVFSILVVRGQ